MRWGGLALVRESGKVCSKGPREGFVVGASSVMGRGVLVSSGWWRVCSLWSLVVCPSRCLLCC